MGNKTLPVIKTWANGFYMVAFFALLLFLGYMLQGAQIMGYTLPTVYKLSSLDGTTAAQPQSVSYAPTGVQLTADTTTAVDIKSKVVESIADTTGVNQTVQGEVDWYKSGDTSPFETTAITEDDVFTSSTNDGTIGEQIFPVFINSSYYTALGPTTTVPASSSMSATISADLINTLALTMQNSTSGDWQSTGMTQTLGADEAKTLTVKLSGSTARGVFKAPIYVCLDYDTGNFSSTGTYLVNGKKTSIPNVASGYEACYISTLSDITDVNEVTQQVRLGPQNGVNPATNVTVLVIDGGATYTKATGNIVYTGPENADTLAAIGATDQSFVVVVE